MDTERNRQRVPEQSGQQRHHQERPARPERQTRPEQPERPDGQEAGFGPALRERRRAAGLSQAELAALVHYDKSHISKVENGDKPATAAFARACDRELRTGGALAELAVRGQCPYPGLACFRAEDERWFHGRDRARAELLALLGERWSDRGGPVVVVGPSGAGKSSLLRAGLAPALRRGLLPALGPAAAEVFAPGAEPSERLAAVAAGTAPVWVVDQAEELFTLCADPEERRSFLDRLCREGGPDGSRLVVLGVRADLYGELLAHEGMLRAVRRGQFALGPMSAEELGEAITAPARTARLELEPGLLDVLLADLGAHGGPDARAADPGSLPLLAHTLRAVWQQRAGRSLSLAGYRAIGGLRGSVALTAERAWSRLDEPSRATARRVLLRLVHLGPDGQASRRHAELDRLAEVDAEPGRVAAVLASFAADRLVTLDGSGAALSHEALLRAWPRLRGWIEESRSGLLTHQQLAQDAGHWAGSGQEDALLYRGSRLAGARDWAAAGGEAELTPVEREFLAASVARAERQQRTERRRLRARRQLAGLLALVLVAAGLAGGLLWQEHGRATAAERGRTALTLLTDARLGTARNPFATLLWSVEAHRTADAGVPELRRAADDAVLSTQAQYLTGRIPGFRWGVNGLALSPDGRLVATGDAQGRVSLWDARTTAPVAELQGEVRHPVQDVEFSPDGTVLAVTLTNDKDRHVLLWRVADRAPLPSPVMPPSITGKPTSAKRLAFSADGALLAAGSGDPDLPGRVWVWRTDAGAAPPVRTLLEHTGAIQGLAFGPGHLLASADSDGGVLLRDLDAPPTAAGGAPALLAAHAPTPRSLAFAADGRLLTVGDERGGIRLWRPPATDPDSPDSPGSRPDWSVSDLPPRHGGAVNALALTPDGTTLVSAGADGRALAWDVPTGRVTAELRGHPTFVLGAAIGRDGRTVVTSAGISAPTGTVLLWDLRRGTDLAPAPGRPPVTAVAAAGDRAAVGTADGRLALWDVAGPEPRPIATGTPDGVPSGVPVAALAFDRAGRTLVELLADGSVLVRDPADGSVRAVQRVDGVPEAAALSPDGSALAVSTTGGDVLAGAPDGTPLRLRWRDRHDHVQSMVFLPDGTRLACAHDSPRVGLLDLASPDPAMEKSDLLHQDLVRRVALSPDGRLLATAGNDRLIRLWDTGTGRPQDEGERTTAEDTLLGLAFSPDGRSIAGATHEGRLLVWSATAPSAPVTLTGPARSFGGLAFLSDGRALLGGDDGTAPVWTLDPAAATTAACAVVHAPLPPAEWRRLLPTLPYRPACG
ncbi:MULTISPECIES: helix-turn-helix domain-containing protein [Kitasatospora]|uniref:Putative transcriptional regulator n=1 Tax=Kitasatospora setae (strain ATCC 33774 / DSM 43861 / JCM 3304 / KCC A-0304 / NBRC 14216 / KM-6054) TaxID=452652 RepID=E4N618_KITSK|nr:helix-turn-helix domain-containing protein [Kitasatospora setae]BAJ26649.1 putative transcriptional regulator [Kitasatospora setae KM-6054]